VCMLWICCEYLLRSVWRWGGDVWVCGSVGGEGAGDKFMKYLI
jgi:hypothetical protein